MISLSSSPSGAFDKTKGYLNRFLSGEMFRGLDRYGQAGIIALSRATPIDSGLAADSWKYRIVQSTTGPTIEWYNIDVESGLNVAILIQYGHGTGSGSYVSGRDYINPAIRPLFDQIVADVEKEVSRYE